MKAIKKKLIETTSYFAKEQMISHKSKFGRRIKNLYRSIHEERFAKSLKNLGISYEFERYGFKIINRSGIELHYIPDFYINDTNLFIEIASNVTKRIRHKILLFKEQYPRLELMLLTKNDVQDWIRGKFDIDFERYKIKEKNND